MIYVYDPVTWGKISLPLVYMIDVYGAVTWGKRYLPCPAQEMSIRGILKRKLKNSPPFSCCSEQGAHIL
jgi:hypothetical protein